MYACMGELTLGQGGSAMYVMYVCNVWGELYVCMHAWASSPWGKEGLPSAAELLRLEVAYVCMYVSIYVCIYVYMYICMYKYSKSPMYACT